MCYWRRCGGVGGGDGGRAAGLPDEGCGEEPAKNQNSHSSDEHQDRRWAIHRVRNFICHERLSTPLQQSARRRGSLFLKSSSGRNPGFMNSRPQKQLRRMQPLHLAMRATGRTSSPSPRPALSARYCTREIGCGPCSRYLSPAQATEEAKQLFPPNVPGRAIRAKRISRIPWRFAPEPVR